jgi:hypothetical protein
LHRVQDRRQDASSLGGPLRVAKQTKKKKQQGTHRSSSLCYKVRKEQSCCATFVEGSPSSQMKRPPQRPAKGTRREALQRLDCLSPPRDGFRSVSRVVVVFVVCPDKPETEPLVMPCTERRARLLLARGRAFAMHLLIRLPSDSSTGTSCGPASFQPLCWHANLTRQAKPRDSPLFEVSATVVNTGEVTPPTARSLSW